MRIMSSAVYHASILISAAFIGYTNTLLGHTSAFLPLYCNVLLKCEDQLLHDLELNALNNLSPSIGMGY